MYTVNDILKDKGHECWTVEPDSTVYEALKKMAGHNVGAVLVTKDDDVLGFFSERDYARKVILKGKTSRDSLVGDLMSEIDIFVYENTTIDYCMSIMNDKRLRHLAVLNKEEKLTGIISIGDVIKKLIKEQDQTIHQLEDYIDNKR